MKLVKIMNNFHSVNLGSSEVFFSYETPIGIIDMDDNVFVSTNDWSRTTGKHINWIKKIDINYAQIPHQDLLDIIQLNR